jgi:pyruvate formate lyase activating enzyme
MYWYQRSDMKEARFYEKLEEGAVRCLLCPHHCRLTDSKIGICGVRQNREGTLYSLVYGRPSASHVDPIEKKPLFHVFPGTSCYSVATVGCNFRCAFCQNHDISQVHGEITGHYSSAEAIVRSALDQQCTSVACTYTEPTVFYEFAFDIVRLAHEQGLATVFVSNGFVDPEPLQEVAPYLTAANVDLKAWDAEFYRRVIGGELEAVLKSLKLLKKLGVWLEVTTLLIPQHISESDLGAISLFIREELGAETPWHISRFHPQYHFTHLPPTPVSLLHRARDLGIENGLRYVYSGNIPGDVGEHTFCHHCGEKVIERYGFTILHNRLQKGCCPHCNTRMAGVGM